MTEDIVKFYNQNFDYLQSFLELICWTLTPQIEHKNMVYAVVSELKLELNLNTVCNYQNILLFLFLYN